METLAVITLISVLGSLVARMIAEDARQTNESAILSFDEAA
jgi:hypothetical protein